MLLNLSIMHKNVTSFYHSLPISKFRETSQNITYSKLEQFTQDNILIISTVISTIDFYSIFDKIY